AVFDAYGVHEVRSLDEMADAIELFSSPRRVHAGRGVASIHDSGGERALFVDLATEHEVPIASVSETTLGRIAATLDPGLEAANPLDAWGTGIDADRIFRKSFACSPTTGSRRWPRGAPRAHPPQSMRPKRSATRSRSRRRPLGSRTRPMRTASASISLTLQTSGPPTTMFRLVSALRWPSPR